MRTGIPTKLACRSNHGPDYGQWTREASQAYQAVYANWDGLGDAFAAAWAKVAQRFAHRPEVLGLELINEPFAGVSSTTVPEIWAALPQRLLARAQNGQLAMAAARTNMYLHA